MENEKQDNETEQPKTQQAPQYTPAPEATSAAPVEPTAPATKHSGLAITSIVTGVIAIVIPVLGIILGIVAIITGAIAMKKRISDKGLSIAGIVTGIVGILINLVLIFTLITSFMLMSRITTKANDAIKRNQATINATKAAINKATGTKLDFDKDETGIFNNFLIKVNSSEKREVPKFSHLLERTTDEKQTIIVINLSITNTGTVEDTLSYFDIQVGDDQYSGCVDSSYNVEPILQSQIGSKATVTGNVVCTLDSGPIFEDIKLLYSESVLDPVTSEYKTYKYSIMIEEFVPISN